MNAQANLARWAARIFALVSSECGFLVLPNWLAPIFNLCDSDKVLFVIFELIFNFVPSDKTLPV